MSKIIKNERRTSIFVFDMNIMEELKKHKKAHLSSHSNGQIIEKTTSVLSDDCSKIIFTSESSDFKYDSSKGYSQLLE